MKKSLVIELHEFSLLEGINDEALIKAFNKAQMKFFRKQEGFIQSELLKAENDWVNISYWRGTEEAKLARKNFLEHSSCLPFVQMVSPSSERKIYLERILSYKSVQTI